MRTLAAVGWVLALGCLHFGVEVSNAVAHKPATALGGHVKLPGPASVTAVALLLAIAWLACAVVLRLRNALRRTGNVPGLPVSLVVAASVLFAVLSLVAAYRANIELTF